MLAGLVIVPVVSLFTAPPKKDLVENIFACYNKKVVVSAVDAIGDPVIKEEVQ